MHSATFAAKHGGKHESSPLEPEPLDPALVPAPPALSSPPLEQHSSKHVARKMATGALRMTRKRSSLERVAAVEPKSGLPCCHGRDWAGRVRRCRPGLAAVHAHVAGKRTKLDDRAAP